MPEADSQAESASYRLVQQQTFARQFTLFDNFYCSGVLSADGHQWVNEAYVTDYLEKAFGGFTRS